MAFFILALIQNNKKFEVIDFGKIASLITFVKFLFYHLFYFQNVRGNVKLGTDDKP